MTATNAGVVVEFSRSGDFLTGYDWNSTLHVWEPWSGEVLFRARLQDCLYLGFGRDDQLRVAQLSGGEVRISELVRSPTFHTAAGVRSKAQNHLSTLATSPGGRLLAAGSDDGVVLFDLDGRVEVGRLPIGMARGVAFDSSGALWTNGASGVLRWPVADDADGTGVRVGPPEWHRDTGSDCQIACSDDGGVVAVASPSGAVLLRRDRPGQAIPLTPHTDPRYVAVSPRGEWVATGSHSGDGVRIWNATDGTLAHNLQPGQRLTPVSFSPDGEWLLTPNSSGDYRLWRCGTWQPGPSLGRMNHHIPNHAAFSRNGKIVVLNTGAGRLCLFETASGRELAHFQTPCREFNPSLTYSSERGRVVAQDWKCLHIWDLNATRTELDALGMSWEVPTPGARPAVTTPLRLTVVGPNYEQNARDRLEKWDRVVAESPAAAAPRWERARVLSALGRYDAAASDLGEAINHGPTAALYYARAVARRRLGQDADSIADLRAALAAGPAAHQEASICNQLAWTQLMGAPAVRDPDSAAALAARAVRLAPDNLNYANTLGVAHYRLGRFDDAIPHLRRSLRGAASPGHDLFFLAMCYRRLEDRARAQDCYDQACYWASGHAGKLPPHVRTELEAIGREAQLLGWR
jgi:WD40 repeat protein